MRIVRTSSVLMIALVSAHCGPKSTGNTTPQTGNPTTNTVVDAGPPPKAKLRVINASSDPALASVNPFFDSETNSFADQPVDFKGTTRTFISVDSGTHSLKIRKAGDASDPLVSQEITLTADKQFTAILHGIPGGDPVAAIDLSEDNAQAPEAGKAKLRLFHAIAGAGAVDVCTVPARRGAAATPIMANLAYGKWGEAGGSAYIDITPDQEYKFQLRAQNAAPCTGAIVGTATAVATSGSNASAILVGTTARRGQAPSVLLCTDPPGEPECQTMPIQMGR